MNRLGLSSAAAMIGVLAAGAARAEGTAQLGADQDVREGTVIHVDILAAGEVINITVGNDSDSSPVDPTPVSVRVYDPSNDEVPGSPFSVGPGDPGWSEQADVLITSADTATPLQVIAAGAGVYAVEFDNPRLDSNGDDVSVVDPLDITVTPDTSTSVNPAVPPDGFGRVHSTRWMIDAHSFAQSAATNAEFYVRVPITGTQSDYTWLLRFDGLAGNVYDVAGNDIGLPPPHSGFSEDRQIASAPEPQYDIYLNVPEVARGGGDITPVVSDFEFEGPSSLCDCALGGQESTFRFQSDVDGVYEIVIDVDGDDTFDPSSGDVLLKGTAVAGANAVSWDGTQPDGLALVGGSYRAELSVRLGEFHFVGSDIETSYPGVRIFGVEPPDPDTVPTPTLMFWDDTRINSTLSTEHNTDPDGLVPAEQRSVPVTTKPDGLSSGDYDDPTDCGRDATSVQPNAHCWGNSQNAADPLSPGNYRYVDTYTFFEQSEAVQVGLCTWDAAGDEDSDGISNLDECTSSSPMDPRDADTDSDGISDGDETGGNVRTDPTVADTDGDCVPDGVEDTNQNGSLDPGELDPTDVDSDVDGIPDGVERGSDPNEGCAPISGATLSDPLSDDSDADGIPDGVEDRNLDGQLDVGETHPAVEDTDADGIPDGVEDGNQNGTMDTGETDPADADTDGDGLSDGVEDADQDGTRDVGETDPLAVDTDEDGLDDGLEDRDGDGRVDAGETDPRSADTDGDGLPDGLEDADRNGGRDAGETDPTNPDSDGDGLSDGIEDANQDGTLDERETDPNDRDSDGDRIDDGVEDSNHNGRPDTGETDPRDADSDDDGLEDGEEDADQDGRVDAGETDPLDPDTDSDRQPDGVELGIDSDGSPIEGATLTDPLCTDTDRDGLSDGDEDLNHNGVFDVDDTGTETDPTDRDSDDDGLLDSVERGYNVNGSRITNLNVRQTNPLQEDSDGDGIPDGIEDASRDGVFDPNGDPAETDPKSDDTDGDGLRDGREDADHDGIVDPGETDPRDPDTDDGGEPDGSEVNLTGHDPLQPEDDRPPTFALYGGGCSCHVGRPASSVPAGTAALLLGLLLLMRRRRRRVPASACDTGAGS